MRETERSGTGIDKKDERNEKMRANA